MSYDARSRKFSAMMNRARIEIAIRPKNANLTRLPRCAFASDENFPRIVMNAETSHHEPYRQSRPEGGAQGRAAGAREADSGCLGGRIEIKSNPERSGVEKQLKRMRALGPMPNLVGGYQVQHGEGAQRYEGSRLAGELWRYQVHEVTGGGWGAP